MKGFPIYMNIENKKIGVIGGGRSAFIKVKKLIDFNASFSVIAPCICGQIIQMQKIYPFVVIQKKFCGDDLAFIDIVIAAADPKTNEMVYREAKKRNLLCSVSSNAITGDFILPSHKKQGEMVATVTTGGKYPLLSKQICDRIDLDTGENLEYLKNCRNQILKNVKNKEMQKSILKELVENENYKCKNKIDAIIKRYLNEQKN